MNFTVEYEQEEDGRWLAEVKELPGVMVYENDPDDAVAHAQALALRVVSGCLDDGMTVDELLSAYPQLSREAVEAVLAHRGELVLEQLTEISEN